MRNRARLKAAADPSNIESLSEDSDTSENTTSSSTDSSDDIRDQLKKLKALFEDDLINEDEYKAKKKELLDKM